MAVGDITNSSGKVVRSVKIKKPSGGYYSNSGYTSSGAKKKKTSSKTSSGSSKVIAKSAIPQLIQTKDTKGNVKTWKGDPKDTAAIKAWKDSYKPGYKSQIISPRDDQGNYDSKGTTYTISCF